MAVLDTLAYSTLKRATGAGPGHIVLEGLEPAACTLGTEEMSLTAVSEGSLHLFGDHE